MACNCIDAVNEQLAQHNAMLVTTLALVAGRPRRVSVEVEKRDSKVRKTPPRMIASHCPFCGERYAAEQADAVLIAQPLPDQGGCNV